MPVKKIFQIEIDDSRFKQFKELFDRYQAAVAKLPQDWKKIAAAAAGVAAAHKAAAENAEKQSASVEKQAQALDKAAASSDSIFHSWQSIATSAHEFDKALERSTIKIAKWGGLAAGVLGGLGAVGIGGSLFGLDRLAGSISSARTQAMGLGVSYGQLKSYDINYGRLVHAGNVMSNISEGKYDVTSDQYKALMVAGIPQRDIQTKNAADLMSEFMGRLPTLFAGVPKGMIGTKAAQYGLNNIISTQDIVAYLNASPDERKQIEEQTRKDAKDIDLQDSVQRQWQDFITQLGRASETIKARLMDKLSIIEPGLEDLSKTITNVVAKFVDSGAAKIAINWLGVELNKFADYVGTKEFQDDIANFVKWVGDAAKGIWNFVSYFSGVSAAHAEGAPSGQSLNTGDFQPGDYYDPTTGHVVRGGATGPYRGNAGIPKYWTPALLKHAEQRLEKEAGLSPMGASALVARFTQEAPGGPSQVNSIGATGINQALGGRRPPGYASWSIDQQLDYIIENDLNAKAQERALSGLRAARTPEEGSIAAADYERAEGYSPGRGDILSSSTPAQKVYDLAHPKSVVIRNQSGANAPRSTWAVAQPYAPATAQ